MRVLTIRTAITVLPLLLACGGDDAPQREALGEPSTGSDAALAADVSTDAASVEAARNDAGALQGSDASASGDAGAEPPPLTLERALDPAGVDSSTERAMLVVDAACKARVPCGQGGPSVAACIDLTINEWALGALFFSEECVDAQIDLYACLAVPACDAEASCSAPRAAQTALCAMEQ